jgi:Methyltransferase domain
VTNGINYQRLYEYRFRAVDQARRAAVWREIAGYIYRHMGSPERVLDPGAGRCEFVNAVPAAERWAVDMLDCGQYAVSDVKVVYGDVLETDLPAAYFDGVFVSNMLEHLPTQDAVGTALGRLHTVMERRGTIAVLGPNFRHCMSQYFDCADGSRAPVRGRLRGHHGHPAVPALLVPRATAALAAAHQDLPAHPAAVALARQAVPGASHQALAAGL